MDDECREIWRLFDAIHAFDLDAVCELVNDQTRFAYDIFGHSVVSMATGRVEQLGVLRFLLDTDRISELMSEAVIGCARNDNLEALKITFEVARKYGLDINCPIWFPAATSNDTPLSTAIRYGRLEMVEWLLLHGADVDAQVTLPSGKVISLLQLAGSDPYRMYSPEIVNLLEVWMDGGATIKSAK